MEEAKQKELGQLKAGRLWHFEKKSCLSDALLSSTSSDFALGSGPFPAPFPAGPVPVMAGTAGKAGAAAVMAGTAVAAKSADSSSRAWQVAP